LQVATSFVGDTKGTSLTGGAWPLATS